MNLHLHVIYPKLANNTTLDAVDGSSLPCSYRRTHLAKVWRLKVASTFGLGDTIYIYIDESNWIISPGIEVKITNI